ncbi:MAG: hypothetical protein KC496_20245, partial [Anaerolineae bacterium]|nr:hypothetical protein [Anaerolineae bacterium]
GLPLSTLTTTWRLLDGPTTVTITTPDALTTDITFSAGGTYVFEFSADDGEYTSSDTMTVQVDGPVIPPPPLPPEEEMEIPGCLALPNYDNPTYAEGVEIMEPVELQVKANLNNTSVYYWLASDPDNTYQLLTQPGDVAVDDIVATFDPTLLANDIYVVQLVGENAAGETRACGIPFIVQGEYKPGRVVLSTVDFTVPLAGLPVTIGRTYDSLERNYEDDFGYGWSLLIGNPRLEVGESGNVTMTMPDGSRKTFMFTPTPYSPMFYGAFLEPIYSSEPGEYGTLSVESCSIVVAGGPSGWQCFLGEAKYADSITSFSYEDPYGRVFRYNVEGELQSIRDLTGNELIFSEGGINRIDENDQEEQVVTFVRNASGYIETIIDLQGNEYDYIYDSNGDLAEVHLPEIASPIEYTYYSGGVLDHL